ncbi:Ada metal-binding domain-containing protein [Brachyspira intermedia]|uniref:Ada metal-binding domain-containing protein n=1 Tax=Brachyspira intermedia TaxID=84377 RepID=UPI0026381D3D|nr:Ada metal-binding domain-containing protein [uncultured Brachyspira sp.]
MKLKIIKLFLLLLIISITASSQEKIVYITRTGEKYHLEHCSSLRRSKIKITLSEAIKKGYEPCKRCKP